MFKSFNTNEYDPNRPFQPRRSNSKGGWLTTPQKRLMAYIAALLIVALVIVVAIRLGLGSPPQEEVLHIRKPVRGPKVLPIDNDNLD